MISPPSAPASEARRLVEPLLADLITHPTAWFFYDDRILKEVILMTEKVGKDILEQEMERELPPYEPPQVVTHRDDDLLAELGPAQACSFGHSVIQCEEAPPWEPWRAPGPSG